MSEKNSAHTIVCLTCGESWDLDTPGYAQAKQTMDDYQGVLCPSCEPGQDDVGGGP